MNTLRRIALLAAAAAAAACMSDSPDEFSFPARDNPPPAGWVESGPFLCHDFDVLWETAKHQVVHGDYRIDDDATTYKKRRIITNWRTELATTKGDGKRRRRYVDFVEQKDVKNGWKVRVSTVVQRNADIDDPLNPVTAEWRPDAPDVEDAERIAWTIETQFRDLGPSKEFEMR